MTMRRVSFRLLCAFQVMLLCNAFNITQRMMTQCDDEMQWQSSIVVQLMQHFQWTKLAFVTYDNQKCLQEFMFKQFSQHLIPAVVFSADKKSIYNLNNSNTVIFLIRKTINVNSVLEIIHTKLQTRYFPTNWVLIHKSETVNFISLFIPHDINIFLIETESTKKTWHVFRLFSTTGNEIIKKHVGSSHIDSDELKIRVAKFPKINLMGEKIRFVTITFEPYFTPDKFQPKDGGKPTGLYGEIVGTIQSFINFSILMSVSTDNQFGKLTIYNNVTGILGKLSRNESDVGVGLALSKGRVNLINYSTYLHSMDIKIIYHQIYRAKPRFFFYLEPFSSASWTCNFVLTFFVAFLLSITYICTHHVINVNCKKIKINQRNKWFQIFIEYSEYMVFTLFRTGVPVTVYGVSGHIIIQIFHTFTLIMFTSYSSTLTSILTVSKLFVPFESLEDVVYRSSYTLSTLRGTIIEEAFKNTDKEGVLADGWQKMASNLDKYLVTSNQKGLDLVYKEKNAYIMEKASITVVLKGNCSFRFVKEPVNNRLLCIGFRIGFAYKTIFNSYLQKLKENGMMLKINNDNLPLDHNDMCEDTNLFSSLKLPKVVGIFFTLSAGIFLSLIILIIEVSIYNYQEHFPNN
uniref:Ionotropic glutamate receptor C-terminal domain-containing protein n=1 Tax=Strigamia maritima TaxID=126957 RepID=T1J6L4_STRMM